MTKIYDGLPVNLFPFYEQEGEDYGIFGFGNVDGQPLRTWTYYSTDPDADEPIKFAEILKPFIEDKEKRLQAADAIMAFILNNSVSVSDSKEADMFFEGEL